MLAALRTDRDRGMVTLMLFGGLRRCEVLGLAAPDVHAGGRRVFVSSGKGGHQRIVPVAATFFEHLGRYFDLERPDHSSTDQVFVVLKGPNRGKPLSAAGLDEILSGARKRAVGGDPGPSRSRVDRIDQDLFALGQRLAGR